MSYKKHITLQFLIKSTEVAEELKTYIDERLEAEGEEIILKSWYTLEDKSADGVEVHSFTYNVKLHEESDLTEILLTLDYIRQNELEAGELQIFVDFFGSQIEVRGINNENELTKDVLESFVERMNLQAMLEFLTSTRLAQLETQVEELVSICKTLDVVVAGFKVMQNDENSILSRVPAFLEEASEELGISDLFEEHMSSMQRVH